MFEGMKMSESEELDGHISLLDSDRRRLLWGIGQPSGPAKKSEKPCNEEKAKSKEERRLRHIERTREWQRKNPEKTRQAKISHKKKVSAAKAAIRAEKVDRRLAEGVIRASRPKTSGQIREAAYYQRNREKKLASVKARQAAILAKISGTNIA